MSHDCSLKCVCGEAGDVICTSMECHESAQCAIKNGVRDCYCKRGFTGDGLNCQAGNK